MSDITNIPSHQRKGIKDMVRAGKYVLRVVSGEEGGFVLCGQRGQSLIRLSKSYPTREAAVEVGERRFGKAAAEAEAFG